MSLTSEPTNNSEDMMTDLSQFANPTHLTLACGHVVPNVKGTVTYNYYDFVWDMVKYTDAQPDVDTSGRLPNGVTYWFSASGVDNSRSVCQPCGVKQHDCDYVRKRDAQRNS